MKSYNPYNPWFRTRWKEGKFQIYTCRGEDAKHRVSTVWEINPRCVTHRRKEGSKVILYKWPLPPKQNRYLSSVKSYNPYNPWFRTERKVVNLNIYLSWRRREASRLYSLGNNPWFRTPRDVVKHDSIDATYKDGILNIHIPKKKGDARWLTKLFP